MVYVWDMLLHMVDIRHFHSYRTFLGNVTTGYATRGIYKVNAHVLGHVTICTKPYANMPFLEVLYSYFMYMRGFGDLCSKYPPEVDGLIKISKTTKSIMELQNYTWWEFCAVQLHVLQYRTNLDFIPNQQMTSETIITFYHILNSLYVALLDSTIIYYTLSHSTMVLPIHHTLHTDNKIEWSVRMRHMHGYASIMSSRHKIE